VAVGTGLRFGEITALMVKDLALDAATPTLTVRRAWKRNGTGEFAGARDRYYLGKPKARQSRRRVSLSPTVAEILRELAAGKEPDDLIFTAPHGGRLDQAHWYEGRWRPAVRAAGRRGLAKTPRFHDLRHTHAAWLISAGVPLPVIQKRLGHKSIQITVDVSTAGYSSRRTRQPTGRSRARSLADGSPWPTRAFRTRQGLALTLSRVARPGCAAEPCHACVGETGSTARARSAGVADCGDRTRRG
jgi:integrase